MPDKNFDIAVTLYNIDHGLGNSNIDILACAANPKEARGYNSRGTFVAIDASKAFRKSIMEKTTFFWLGINYTATIVLFLIITLALICEWGIRKLTGQKSPAAAPEPKPPTSAREPEKVVTQV